MIKESAGKVLMDSKCKKCGKTLTQLDIGATKKFINRGAEEFMCISCLCDFFKVSEDLIMKKIEEFKASGCTLF